MAGRPSKLTPEIAQTIEHYLLQGSFLETAVIAAGIGKQTFYDWMHRGHKDVISGEDTDYATFHGLIERTLARVEIDLVNKLQNEGGQQWTRYAWMLERRFRERWAMQKSLAPEK